MTEPLDATGGKPAQNAKRLFDGTVGVLITLVAVDFLLLLKVPPSALHLIPVALALPLAYVAYRAWKASAPLHTASATPEDGTDDAGRERNNLAVATLSAGMARSGGAVGMANAARAARANETDANRG